MKPSEIFDIMELAKLATESGNIFVPLFTGPPGVGKSHIVQAWCKSKGIPFIDRRIAYDEAPDFTGFPVPEIVKDRQICVKYIPEDLPSSGAGVFLLEEPNRGTTSVMNCLMQVLTDRKIGKYTLPPGWIIAACINEGADYDTNGMDPALKNRFVQFNVAYDKGSFVEYMRAADYHPDIRNFIEANMWSFKDPESIGNVAGAKYVSPRTWSQVNSVLATGGIGGQKILQAHELTIFEAILGSLIAKDFYNFRHNESPVMFADLKKNKKAALKKLVRFADPNNYKNGMISLTVRDIVEDNTIEDDLLSELIEVLPVEQSKALLHELEYKRKDDTILQRLGNKNKTIKELFKSIVNLGK